MLEKYAKYSEKIKKFKEEIYFYCDCNNESEALFPAFVNLWPENTGEKRCLSGKDLAILTSSILNGLVEKGVLELMPNYEESHSPYPLYKIKAHENLMKYDAVTEKKMELIKILNEYRKV